GDGRADVCARAPGGVACWLWTGQGFGRQVPGPALSDAAGWDQPGRFWTLRLADVDGDGRADLSARGPAWLISWQSSGKDSPTELLGPSWRDAAGWNAPETFTTFRLASMHHPLNVPKSAAASPFEPPGPGEDAGADGGETGCSVNRHEREAPP